MAFHQPEPPVLSLRACLVDQAPPRKERKSSATKTIMSVAYDGLPRTPAEEHRAMIPSSITRLVEAIWNAIAAVKFAPCGRASAPPRHTNSSRTLTEPRRDRESPRRVVG
jgi:hypothetical protein